MAKEYKITAAEIPAPERAGGRVSVIDEAINAFLETGIKSGKVETDNPKSTYQAFRNRVKRTGAPVKIYLRKNTVYIEKAA